MLGTSFISVPIGGAPGCTAYVGPTYLFLPAFTTPSGSAAIPLPLPCTPFLQGLFFACQWLILVPGFNAAGIIVSDDIDISWSH